ncbi:MBL fold metallo-hydrolase [Streptomyces sp. LP05-1]|uniref:MBL fold metallo-hydrolase n=1 Tax=Streptomyces pyxinae TaxID=2970734 RepID=A0ABT2CHV2_9ACTN|nr:MBL fold metallo-hydrolase [Streptomyces sp. LP05-1]MCS0636981.1 MBL fold metallo-hydrolase [Streptomyces sp. LP05-1]
MKIIEVRPRLHLLRFPIGQAYLWRDGDIHDVRGDDQELTLIDAGWAGAAETIAEGIRSLGLEPERLRRIVLTHCHRDHVGAAGELARRYGSEILAHGRDAPVVRGEAPVPEPVLLDWEIPLYEHGLTVPPAPPARVDREVADGEELGFGDGARAVHTPGHTDGSMAIHLPRHGVLFTGDTVASVRGVTLGVFHVDRERAKESMRAMAGLAPETVCCGHGDPVTADAAALLREAAERDAAPGA